MCIGVHVGPGSATLNWRTGSRPDSRWSRAERVRGVDWPLRLCRLSARGVQVGDAPFCVNALVVGHRWRDDRQDAQDQANALRNDEPCPPVLLQYRSHDEAQEQLDCQGANQQQHRASNQSIPSLPAVALGSRFEAMRGVAQRGRCCLRFNPSRPRDASVCAELPSRDSDLERGGLHPRVRENGEGGGDHSHARHCQRKSGHERHLADVAPLSVRTSIESRFWLPRAPLRAAHVLVVLPFFYP